MVGILLKVFLYFPMHIYSSVMGLLTTAVGLSIGLGSGLLSYMLSLTDSFTGFLLLGGTLVLLGAINLLRLGSLQSQPAH